MVAEAENRNKELGQGRMVEDASVGRGRMWLYGVG